MTQPLETPRLVVRLWNESDYEMLARWWEYHIGHRIPKEWLVETGYILERDGEPRCAIFAYLTVGKGIANLRWIVGAPTVSLAQTREDLKNLFFGMVAALNALQYNLFFVDAPAPIAREIQSVGFVVASSNNTFLMLQTPL